jgi:hypothetical protein
MRRLSEAEILAVWELGQGRDSRRQALAPLAVAAGPGADSPPAALPLGALPLGRRDRRLLQLRQATLGEYLSAAASCPRCGASSDFEVAVSDLLAAGHPDPTSAIGAAGDPQGHPPDSSEGILTVADFELRFRLLDSDDLTFAATAPGVAAARMRLLERALLSARHRGREVAANELPEAVVTALAEALEDRDPLAVIRLAVDCGRCQQRWLPELDVADFVWQELAGRAERVMYDVQALALAYGWSEAQVLALSPARRHFYIELAPASASGVTNLA